MGKKSKKFLKGFSKGFGAGATIGTVLGSVVPGIGNAIGAAVGGMACGLMVGAYSALSKEAQQTHMHTASLEPQKRIISSKEENDSLCNNKKEQSRSYRMLGLRFFDKKGKDKPASGIVSKVESETFNV